MASSVVTRAVSATAAAVLGVSLLGGPAARAHGHAASAPSVDESFGMRTPRGDAAPLDPSRRGPFATARLDVLRGWQRLDVGLEVKVEDVAEITYPIGSADAARTAARPAAAVGRFPVVVLLHGRHAWCAEEGPVRPEPTPTWCESLWINGTHPVPSYQGYRYLADVLASQGRIVVSISANGINAQDDFGDYGMTARARLVVHHLRSLAAADRGWADGIGGRLAGRVDLDRTVLMGHSRGGEGVVRAAQVLSAQRDPVARVAAVVPFAPTAFARSAPGSTAVVTLLPACDGDVSDLQGQTFTDRARDVYGSRGGIKSSVWFAGGNHNFLNTEWTPGLSMSGTGSDDSAYIYGTAELNGVDGSCAPDRRLTPRQERTIGLAYLSAAVVYAQDGDARMLSLLDGSGALPRSVEQAGLHVRTSSIAGLDRLLVLPTRRTEVVGAARLCRGDALERGVDGPQDVCGDGVAKDGQDTAWLGQVDVAPHLPHRTAVRLRGGSATRGGVRLPRPVDLTQVQRLSMRVVLDPGATGSVHVWLRDAQGRTATVESQGPRVVPLSEGEVALRLVPQTLWIDPRSIAGVDISAVQAVGLATRGSVQAWLLDVSVRDGSPPVPVTDAPAASMNDITLLRIPAGTTREVRVPVTLDRVAREPVTIIARVTAAGGAGAIEEGTFRVRVPAGARRTVIPLVASMPRVIGPEDQFAVSVRMYSLRGAAVGQWTGYAMVVPGGVAIREVQLVRSVVGARPGASLTWRWRTSDGVSSGVSVAVDLVDAAMDYSDLDPQFLDAYGLPESGPITEASWVSSLVTRTSRPGVLQLRVPLAVDATAGAWISFSASQARGAIFPGGAQPLLTGSIIE